MPRTLTAADRSDLIRLASTLPAGSEERRAILAGLSRKASRDDYAVFSFPDFYMLPTSVKIKMREKVEGMGLKFTPHHTGDGFSISTPLPPSPMDKKNLARAVEVLERGIRNRPNRKAGGHVGDSVKAMLEGALRTTADAQDFLSRNGVSGALARSVEDAANALEKAVREAASSGL